MIFVAGDLNLNRGSRPFSQFCDGAQSDLNSGYSRYAEADSVANRATAGNCKYDYIFSQQPHAAYGVFRAPAYMFTPASSVSDHNWYQSYPLMPHGGGSPFGSVDSAKRVPGGFAVTGWAIDFETPDPISVTGSMAGWTGTTTASGARSDVRAVHPTFGPSHGYNFWVTAYLNTGTYAACATGINSGPGTSTTVGCINVEYRAEPIGNLDAVGVGWGFVALGGWTLDPDTSASNVVHIYSASAMSWAGTLGMPGAIGSDFGAASLWRSDVASLFPDWGGNHGFSGNHVVAAGHKFVCAYGLNAAGQGSWSLLGCRQFRS